MNFAEKRSLTRTDKLRLKAEFDQVRRDGRRYPGRGMVLVVAPAPDETLKCAVICGRKFSLLAVVRNRARRLLFESFRLLKPGITRPVRLVFLPRRDLLKWKRQDATRELAKLLDKAEILKAGIAASPPEC